MIKIGLFRIKLYGNRKILNCFFEVVFSIKRYTLFIIMGVGGWGLNYTHGYNKHIHYWGQFQVQMNNLLLLDRKVRAYRKQIRG